MPVVCGGRGANGEAVAKELGYSEAEIAMLQAGGVIAA